MAGRKKKKKSAFKKLEKETTNAIWAIVLLVLALIFLLASFSSAGRVGDVVFSFFSSVLGIGYYLLPTAFFLLGISLLRARAKEFAALKMISTAIFFLSGLGLIGTFSEERGGLVGKIIAAPFLSLFDFTASIIILTALVIISLILLFETKFSFESLLFWRNFNIFSRKELDDEGWDEEYEEEDEEYEEEPSKPVTLTGLVGKKQDAQETDVLQLSTDIPSSKKYVPPPLSLLEKDKGKPGVGDVKASVNIIKRTLQNFGIEVEMDEVSIGPTVTRYSLKPAEGVKLSKILGLQNNLELALAAHPVRIEAPIPGKSLVGIEVPNTSKTLVGLSGLFSTGEYQDSKKPLLIALGKDISGTPRFTNLAKMPHLLIAGSTGSGKSVTIHTIINSILFRNAPENVKLIMIDPKRVELPLYNGIPHLLTPVITNAKKAILALKWTTKEMDRRYDVLESHSSRDIQSYHKNILGPAMTRGRAEGNLPEKMPYIVFVIDELADLMQAYPRELEAGIVRLAQMSRAVGIHLLVSTQRPSVNIITGLIKANIPARVALQVSSQIDSRTILDAAGAEKLLGAGDMLFISSDMSKPQRIQSAFISEREVKSVVKYLKKQYEDELPQDVNIDAPAQEGTIFSQSLEEEDEIDDDLYEDAKETVIHAGKASTSYLQRKLRVGYARAARLMDVLEEQGVIGPSNGSKPRDVLVKEFDDAEEEDSEEDNDSF